MMWRFLFLIVITCFVATAQKEPRSRHWTFVDISETLRQFVTKQGQSSEMVDIRYSVIRPYLVEKLDAKSIVALRVFMRDVITHSEISKKVWNSPKELTDTVDQVLDVIKGPIEKSTETRSLDLNVLYVDERPLYQKVGNLVKEMRRKYLLANNQIDGSLEFLGNLIESKEREERDQREIEGQQNTIKEQKAKADVIRSFEEIGGAFQGYVKHRNNSEHWIDINNRLIQPYLNNTLKAESVNKIRVFLDDSMRQFNEDNIVSSSPEEITIEFEHYLDSFKDSVIESFKSRNFAPHRVSETWNPRICERFGDFLKKLVLTEIINRDQLDHARHIVIELTQQKELEEEPEKKKRQKAQKLAAKASPEAKKEAMIKVTNAFEEFLTVFWSYAHGEKVNQNLYLMKNIHRSQIHPYLLKTLDASSVFKIRTFLEDTLSNIDQSSDHFIINTRIPMELVDEMEYFLTVIRNHVLKSFETGIFSPYRISRPWNPDFGQKFSDFLKRLLMAQLFQRDHLNETMRYLDDLGRQKRQDEMKNKSNEGF